MIDTQTSSEPKLDKASAEGEMAMRADVLAKSKVEAELRDTVSHEDDEEWVASPEPEIEGEVGSKAARVHDDAKAESPKAKKAAKAKEGSGTIASFTKILQEAESSRDPKAISALFAEDAELWRQNFSKNQESDSALVFWKQYLDNFKDVKSEFVKVQELSGLAVLEWVSEGHLKNGDAFHYAGVSILNFEGEGEGSIKSFKTYYDSSALSMKAKDHVH